MDASRRTLAYTIRSVLPFVLVAALITFLLGRAGFLATMMLSLPWFAWRYDNQSGAFFILAVLAVIVLAVLALLILLMAIAH
jgi:hypothetical protein